MMPTVPPTNIDHVMISLDGWWLEDYTSLVVVILRACVGWGVVVKVLCGGTWYLWVSMVP